MRRVSKIAAAGIATAALALSATACGSSLRQSPDEQGQGRRPAYDVGGRGDHSFNDSAAKGYDKAKKDFERRGQGADRQGRRHRGRPRSSGSPQLAEAGYNPVVGVGFAYGPSLTKVGQEVPEHHLRHRRLRRRRARTSPASSSPRSEGSYLAGVAAALKTKTNKVGFIGGVDIPLIKKFEAGFQQGVKDTNPKVKVDVQYLSTADTKASASRTAARPPPRACSTTAST